MKIDINKAEQSLLTEAITQAIASAKRAQTSKGRQPQLLAFYTQQSIDYAALLAKVANAQ